MMMISRQYWFRWSLGSTFVSDGLCRKTWFGCATPGWCRRAWLDLCFWAPIRLFLHCIYLGGVSCCTLPWDAPPPRNSHHQELQHSYIGDQYHCYCTCDLLHTNTEFIRSITITRVWREVAWIRANLIIKQYKAINYIQHLQEDPVFQDQLDLLPLT